MPTSKESQINSLGQKISKVMTTERVSAAKNLTNLDSILTKISFNEQANPQIQYKFKDNDPIVVQDFREMLPKDKIEEITDESIIEYIKQVSLENPLDLIRNISEKEGRILHPKFIEVHSTILDNLERDFYLQNIEKLKPILNGTDSSKPRMERFNQAIFNTINNTKPVESELEKILHSSLKFEKYQTIETEKGEKKISINKILRDKHLPDYFLENGHSIFRSQQFKQYAVGIFDLFIPEKRDHFAKCLIKFYDSIDQNYRNDLACQNFAYLGFKSMNQFRKKIRAQLKCSMSLNKSFKKVQKSLNIISRI